MAVESIRTGPAGGGSIPAAAPPGELRVGDCRQVLRELPRLIGTGCVRLLVLDPPVDAATGAIDAALVRAALLACRPLLHADGVIAGYTGAGFSHGLREVLDEVFGAASFRGELVIPACPAREPEPDRPFRVETDSLALYTADRRGRLRRPGKWETLIIKRRSGGGGPPETSGHDRPVGAVRRSESANWGRDRILRAIRNYRDYVESYGGTRSLETHYRLMADRSGGEPDFLRLVDNQIQLYVPPERNDTASNLWLDLETRGAGTGSPVERDEAPLERLVEWFTEPGDMVLDPFAGTGTAVVVAERARRRWYGIDIDSGLMELARRRLADAGPVPEVGPRRDGPDDEDSRGGRRYREGGV